MTENEFREKVIKGLECCTSQDGLHYSFCEVCPYSDNQEKHCGNTQHLMEDALALLKEQEPVKPIVDTDTWTCGKCGHTLEYQKLLGDNVLFHEQYDYCPGCGKKVKWE